MRSTSSEAQQPWSFSAFEYRGFRLRYAQSAAQPSRENGISSRHHSGPTLLFQHGLGADCTQSLKALLPLTKQGITLISLDCPGHGESSLNAITGLSEKQSTAASRELESARASFDHYVELLMAFIEAMRLENFAMGGISMGAGLTLGVANRFAKQTTDSPLRAMVLVRPAWLDQTHPENLAIIARVGKWIENDGLDGATRQLESDFLYRSLIKTNPLCAASIGALLTRAHAGDHAPALYQMVANCPIRALSELSSLEAPTLVLGNEGDPLHPINIAEQIAQGIPGSQFHCIAPRYLESERHHLELNEIIHGFLMSHLNHSQIQKNVLESLPTPHSSAEHNRLKTLPH